jgi:hypothetical protein
MDADFLACCKHKVEPIDLSGHLTCSFVKRLRMARVFFTRMSRGRYACIKHDLALKIMAEQ